MEQKDYYQIMGLSRDASENDIKMAYRKLARKYHPDISKEPHAEERFKEMATAYETLKDPKKRAEYDQELKYKEYSKNNPFHARYATEEPSFSTQFDSDLFESLFGHSRYKQQPLKGENYTGKIYISLEEAFNGVIKQVQVPIEKGSEVTLQTLKVKIPAGIKSEQQIRLAGKGGPGSHGGPSGDILITIMVDKHPVFDLMNNDIYLTLPIAPWEAALGATMRVPTLAGTIDLKIPPESQGGQKLRIKKRGLPGPVPGDQYVLLKIITPPPKTQEAKELYKKMAEVMPFNPRANLESK